MITDVESINNIGSTIDTLDLVNMGMFQFIINLVGSIILYYSLVLYRKRQLISEFLFYISGFMLSSSSEGSLLSNYSYIFLVMLVVRMVVVREEFRKRPYLKIGTYNEPLNKTNKFEMLAFFIITYNIFLKLNPPTYIGATTNLIHTNGDGIEELLMCGAVAMSVVNIVCYIEHNSGLYISAIVTMLIAFTSALHRSNMQINLEVIITAIDVLLMVELEVKRIKERFLDSVVGGKGAIRWKGKQLGRKGGN